VLIAFIIFLQLPLGKVTLTKCGYHAAKFWWGYQMSTANKLDLCHDYRRSHRRVVIEDARIIDKRGGWSLLNCIVWDISEGGAKIQIDPSLDIPTLFDLLLVGDMKIIPVRIRWRRHHFIGVEFVGTARQAPPFRLC
jgi:hypothetical protein